jgi:hypothetical protein
MNMQRKAVIAILCLIFTTLFLFNAKRDFVFIFEKTMHYHDESSNSVVAANITRDFFPPKVRINPLVEQQGNWMEGPYWQHIPPLFAYVPYLFFKIDGQISIEVKRLAYAFLVWLTGILFINLVFAYSKRIYAAIAATLAVLFWISTPFTHELITGYTFGVSDIVLAFTVVLGLDGVLWYLHKEKEDRLNYPWWKVGCMAILVATPIMAKNLLGAIPSAIFFIALLRDHRAVSKKLLSAVGFFVGVLALYYLPLYFASPETFKNEILISFFHAANYEGWGRPWHYYITNYLPQRYLGYWVWLYFAGLIFAGWYYFYGKLDRVQRLLIGIPLLWFVWNLVVVSLIESKIANFIYQSYLLSLFAITYAVIHYTHGVILRRLAEGSDNRFFTSLRMTVVPVLIISILVTGYEVVRFGQHFRYMRAQAYTYDSEFEKFYQVAELMQLASINEKDLVIARVSDNDCWVRYPILFLRGAEAKTLLEFNFGFDENQIKQKYDHIYFLLNKDGPFPKIDAHGVSPIGDYFLVSFDINRMTAEQIRSTIQAFLDVNKSQIEQDILRIKKDKTSCQWLVPDPILNAP